MATSAITTSGLQTIDGVDLNRGDRVLRAAQEDASENGIYVASAGRWSRASETAIDNFVMAGMTVRVLEGDTGKGLWTMTAPTTGPFVLGTTELTFEQDGFTVGGVSGANQNGAMKLVLGTPSGNPDVDSLYMYADYALKKLKLLWPDGTVTTI